MTLSKNEREQLLMFIKSHYVDHHDVRLLIARDLEEDILQQMNENISFEEELERAYKKYGVIGFSDVCEDYMKKIDKYFRKNVLLKILKDEASSIRFWLFSLLSFLFIFTIINVFQSSPIVLFSVFGLMFISAIIFHLVKLRKNVKKLKKKDDYYYLDQILASNNSILFPLTYIPLYLLIHIERLSNGEFWFIVTIAFFASISVIAFHLIYFKLYKDRSKILKDYQNTYLSKKVNFKLELI